MAPKKRALPEAVVPPPPAKKKKQPPALSAAADMPPPPAPQQKKPEKKKPVPPPLAPQLVSPEAPAEEAGSSTNPPRRGSLVADLEAVMDWGAVEAEVLASVPGLAAAAGSPTPPASPVALTTAHSAATLVAGVAATRAEAENVNWLLSLVPDDLKVQLARAASVAATAVDSDTVPDEMQTQPGTDTRLGDSAGPQWHAAGQFVCRYCGLP